MNVAELLQALDSAPEESTITVRLASGEMCPVSAIHIGAGGDSAGTVSLDCAPVDSMVAAEPEDMSGLDDVDSMAIKAGVDIGRGKPKAAKKPMVDEEGE